ncbi:MAG: 1,4-dihydroxy-2-naphthoate octaprenyltransferase, partial [Nitriliruptoraceae bacterium]
AVNYANDLFDGLAGVDTTARTGPRRAVASGLVTPREMARAMVAAFALAGVAGLALAWMAGWELLVVGAAAIVAALGYSGGSRPYASRGLGEVSVFVFFGVVATVGSQYVQDERLGAVALVASVPVGLAAVALLLVNNLRDLDTDRDAGKRTLAVRLGGPVTRRLYAGCLITTVAAAAAVAAIVDASGPLLALVAAPLAIGAVRRVVGGATGRELVAVLERTAQFQLAFSALLAIGLVVARPGG